MVTLLRIAAFTTYVLLAFIGLLFAIMPPLNMVLVPTMALIAAGTVGAFSNMIEEAKSRAATELRGRATSPADERLMERAVV